MSVITRGTILTVLLLAGPVVQSYAQRPSRQSIEQTKRISLTPSSATVLVQRQIQFSNANAGRSRPLWYVNQIPGGNDTAGWIAPDGLYTAPASVSAGGKVTVQSIGPGSSVATASVTVVYETQLGAPLRRSPDNPRYFANSAGPIYLTGSHTWSNVQDRSDTDPPVPMDYDAYIRFLKSKNHNFTRLWAWTLPKDNCQGIHYTQPFPWPRTGPGLASDGKPKFNVRQFNQAYFDRLRSRVQVAQDNGIFVSVMLFEGVLIQCRLPDDGFPFYSRNNVNGIEAARGWPTFERVSAFPYFTRYFCNHEWITGANPVVLEIQKAYVAKVIDTLNGFDNVIWEVANESGSKSNNWQREIMRFIREYEARLPKQHPVGLTFQYGPLCTGLTETLLQSDADWISPGYDKGDYRGLEGGPEPNDGKKIILLDSDHVGGIYGDPVWVWKSFTRGLNLLYMDDPYNHGGLQFRTFTTDGIQSHIDDAVRVTMGDVLSYARKLQLAVMVPSKSACNTQFALVKAGEEYLCFAPHGGEFSVDVAAGRGSSFTGEMFDIRTRQRSVLDATTGGGIRRFSCPAPDNPCVLLLMRAQTIPPAK